MKYVAMIWLLLLTLTGCQASPLTAKSASADGVQIEDGHEQLFSHLYGRWESPRERVEYQFKDDGKVVWIDSGNERNASYELRATKLEESTIYIYFSSGPRGHYKKLVFSDDRQTIEESVNVVSVTHRFGSNRTWAKID